MNKKGINVVILESFWPNILKELLLTTLYKIVPITNDDQFPSTIS